MDINLEVLELLVALDRINFVLNLIYITSKHRKNYWRTDASLSVDLCYISNNVSISLFWLNLTFFSNTDDGEPIHITALQLEVCEFDSSVS